MENVLIIENKSYRNPSIESIIRQLKLSINENKGINNPEIASNTVIQEHLDEVPFIKFVVNQKNELSIAIPSKNVVEIGDPEIDRSLSKKRYQWKVYRGIPVNEFIEILEVKKRKYYILVDCLNEAAGSFIGRYGEPVKADALGVFRLLEQETSHEGRDIIPV